MRRLSEYYVPIIAALLTLVIIVTAATVTYLVAKDAWGPRFTALALMLYAAGLCGVFAWVRLCLGTPRGRASAKTGYRRVLARVSHRVGIRLKLTGSVEREDIHAGGNINNKMAKRE